jgi:HAD superfamily hydrolase (TIGR01484 family)
MNHGAAPLSRFAYAAFDLDGTLLGDDGTVSAVTEGALRRLKDERIALFVASGRSPYLVGQLNLAPALLQLFEPVMVLRDGDILWNWTTQSIEQMRTVPATVVPALLAAGIKDIVVDTGQRLVATSRMASTRYALFYRCPRSAIEISARPPSDPVTKVTVYAVPHEVTSALADVPQCQVNPGEERLRCTVVPYGSCKTAGISRLMAGVYGEPTLDRVVAFGDGSNDACLLRAAGAGVAMAVAHPETVQNATMQLRGTLAGYLAEEFPGGLGGTTRTGWRCTHQP